MASAAARYWRLIGIEPNVFGGDLELSNLRVYLASSLVDGSVTPTCTFTPSSGSIANLKDGSTSTVARWSGADVAAPLFELKWDFGATQDIDRIDFGSGSSVTRFPYALILQRSTDGITWVTEIGTAGMVAAAANTTYSYAITTAATSTLLLMHGNDGPQQNDSSSNPLTMTCNSMGGANIGTGFDYVIQFNGYGSYMVAYDSRFNLGSSDFTIEFWVRMDTTPWAERPWLTLINDSGSHIFHVRSEAYQRIITQGATQVPDFGTGIGEIHNGTWYHVAITRQSGTGYCFLNGVLRGTQYMGAFPTITGIMIGNSPQVAGGFYGYMEEIRIDNVCRYTTTFALPTAAYAGAGFIGPSSIRPYGLMFTPPMPSTLGKSVVGDMTVSIAAPKLVSIDRQDGGLYRIAGTVKEKATPSNTPLHRKVRLFVENGGRFIRETWSDAVTGEYVFERVRGDQTYMIVAYDYTHSYRAVIADNIVPDLMT